MPEQGKIGDLGVGDILRLLAFQNKTGRLTLKSEQEKLEVFFLNGSMADVHWHTRPEDKDLVAVLLLENIISPEQAQLIRTRYKDTGQRLEYIISNMGFIQEEVLQGTLNIYVIEALKTLFNLQEGEFVFNEMPDTDLELNLAAMLDLKQLRRQARSGREELPYLEARIGDAVHEVSENLFLLPSGPLPPNPSEILGSPRMEFLLKYLQNMFDVIIIDSPPILPASDALLISPHADGVLLVVKAGMLNRGMVQKAVEQLTLAQANIIGVVLNDVDDNKSGYSDYYQKYYSAYYGEQAEKS
jgi:capsular exopolysaccharide synthesis family protein